MIFLLTHPFLLRIKLCYCWIRKYDLKSLHHLSLRCKLLIGRPSHLAFSKKCCHLAKVPNGRCVSYLFRIDCLSGACWWWSAQLIDRPIPQNPFWYSHHHHKKAHTGGGIDLSTGQNFSTSKFWDFFPLS